jgi:hypothetical protein
LAHNVTVAFSFVVIRGCTNTAPLVFASPSMPQVRNFYGKLESPLPSESPLQVLAPIVPIKFNAIEEKDGNDSHQACEGRRRSSYLHEQNWTQLMQEVHNLSHVPSADDCRNKSRTSSPQPNQIRKQVSWQDEPVVGPEGTCDHTQRSNSPSRSSSPIERGDKIVKRQISKPQSDITSSRINASWQERSSPSMPQKIRATQSDLTDSTKGSWKAPNPAPNPQRHHSCTAGVAKAMAEAMRGAFFSR